MLARFTRFLRGRSMAGPGGEGAFRRKRTGRRRATIEGLEQRQLLAVILDSSYTGLLQSGFAPPDTCVAVGPSSVLETINQTLAIYSPKATGTSPVVSRTFSDFWFTQGGLAPASATSGLSDPIVVWNDLVNRFIVGDQDVDNTNHVDTFNIAVSKSATPATLTTADWYFYQVTTTETGRNADYPGNFGYNADAFVFTLNQNQAVNNAGSAVQVVSVKMSDLTAGNALTVGTNLFLNDISGFSIRPTVMHDSVAGDPMWLIESTAGNDNKINVIKMTNVLSAAPTFTTTALTVNSYQGVVQPKQPDGTQITPNSGNNGALWTHIVKAAEYNNTIVAADQVSVSSTQDNARWYVIDVSGATPTLKDQGDVSAGNNTYVVFPSIDINSKGDIGMTYLQSGTGTNQYVSMYVTGRRATDAAGTMETPVLVQAGASNDTTGRLGDLTGICTDSDGSFYAGGEYRLGAINAGLFGTAIAHFTLGTKPVVTAPADQTGVEGASKAFDLGSFTDPDDGPWTVSVDWGDGTTVAFNVATAGSLGTESHVYVEEGSYTVTVTVTDSTNLSGAANYGITVSDPAVVLTGGFTVNAVEGADSGSQTVATFTDPGGVEALSDYSATIDWGDGTASTAGMISGPVAGVFTVTGSHTYLEEGTYTVTTTIKHDVALNATATSSADVADPAVTPTGGFTFNAVEGQLSTVQTVATFTDPGGAEQLTDYSATIDWGDGTAPSAGTITGPDSSGVFTVQGQHTYVTGLGLPDDFGNTFCGATPPSYSKTITITIDHELAPKAQTTSTANIALPPASAHLAGGSLIVVGTTSADYIEITPAGKKANTVVVQLNSSVLGTFTLGTGGRVIVAALDGNDNVQVAGGVTVPTVLYGGPGADRLKGGRGQNILVGCDGNDMLIGGNAGDLLIGGSGADRIVAGAGDDILVAANVVDKTLAEDTKFSDLVNILNGGSFLAADDGVTDVLTGAAGVDTFYYHIMGSGAKDIATDHPEISVNI